uniref:Innexin unc 9 n=1 Tax=Echinococcus granulosus TaxID=6210 RepID=A0A068WIU7_ECHGR|nr:innexin unc 9 [Echinococcus granulosus]
MSKSRLNERHESRTDSMVILEDFGDQLNRIYTPLLILLLAAAAMTNVYFLPQISCNIPTLPADDFRGFAESVCWSRGAIGVDKDEEMPGDEVEWEKLQGRRVTAITTVAWMWRLLVRAHSNSYLRAFLYTSLLAPPPFRSSDTMEVVEVGGGVYQTASLDGALVERFLTEVVGNDGNLMIRMLRCNAGDIVTGEIFVTWWWMFKAMEGRGDEDDLSGYAATPPRTYVEMQEPNLVNRIVRRTMSYI